jgi:hypothetical protein
MGRIADDAKTTARIWTLDIERAPGTTAIFDQRTRGFIHVDQWLTLPSLLCFAAKEYRTRTVEFHAAWDDYDAMVRRSWDIYDDADIMVTFYGTGFDHKHLRWAWKQAGLPQPRPWKDVDLYRVGRKQFLLESGSLNYMCRALGIPGKRGKYDAAEALACLQGDMKARRDMERYNKGDVIATERCYDELRTWIPNHPHISSDLAADRTCNRCGSKRLTPCGEYLAKVLTYAQYRCDHCGGISKAGMVRRVARTQGVA